jgi:secreted Zn-dependent insulinase-like peptidase
LNVLLDLFLQTAKRDVFYQLRSVEQLGYIVFLIGRYVPAR